jgi:hypothetical protein
MKRNEELETMKKMVLAWKGSYLDIAGEVGGGDFLWKDFLEEIEELASPYVMRLYRTGAIDGDQADEFMGFCRAQVEELSKTVGEEGKHG